MNKAGLDELKKLLVSGVESLVESEAKKLKTAVENARRHGIGFATAEQDGGAELLVSAGLLHRAGGAAGLHKEEFYYKATAEGLRIYELIYGKQEESI